MDNGVFNYEKSLIAMLIKYIDNLSFLEDNDKSTLFEIVFSFRSDISELHKIYESIIKKDTNFSTNNKLLKYELKNNRYKVLFSGKSLEVNYENLKTFLSGAIDMLEDIFPLGTVVKLKSIFTKDIFNETSDGDKVRFIIMKRFLTLDNNPYYFTYAAVPYPVGELEDGKMIYFTSQAIDKVIYKGFSDIQEEAYISVMKNEMIIKKGMNSISFASEEERSEFVELINVQIK